MTAMVSLWYKLTDRKKQTLISVIRGFAFFVVLFIITKYLKIAVCPIKNTFNASCPGCGLTSGFMSVLRLDFKTATAHNVLSVPLFFSCVIYVCLAFFDVFSQKCYVEKLEMCLSKKYMYFVYAIIIITATILNNIDLQA